MTSSLSDRVSGTDAFARALGRETHVLSERPDLPWHQLSNRLQWSDAGVRELLESERDEPWLRSRLPFRESETLNRVLT